MSVCCSNLQLPAKPERTAVSTDWLLHDALSSEPNSAIQESQCVVIELTLGCLIPKHIKEYLSQEFWLTSAEEKFYSNQNNHLCFKSSLQWEGNLKIWFLIFNQFYCYSWSQSVHNAFSAGYFCLTYLLRWINTIEEFSFLLIFNTDSLFSKEGNQCIEKKWKTIGKQLSLYPHASTQSSLLLEVHESVKWVWSHYDR